MKKIIVLILIVVCFKTAISQTVSVYCVLLKDKKDSPFLIDKPIEYLSTKAIERRKKQNIKINESDLPVNPVYIDAIKSTGVNIQAKSKWMNAVFISTDNSTKINTIRAFDFVKEINLYSTPTLSKQKSKFISEYADTAVPPENTTKAITTDYYNYGPSYFQAHQLGADCLHNLGYHGEGMTVCFLDAGYFKADSLPAFDSLRTNHQILGAYDFVSHDTFVYEDFMHGMNTLSCVGGNIPGRLVGTAPKANFWLLRTEDAGTETLIEETYWLEGAEFADSVGADVINSSLGYSTFDGGIGNHSYSDLDGNTTIVSKAADWAASKGIFVCSSAGNSAGAPWYKITAPADADSILTVGAIDSAGVIAGFSSRGLSFDGRIKPNTVARGVYAVTAAPGGDIWYPSGTSFSSPITCGAVTCLWQAHPTATNIQLLDAIEQSSSQYFFPDSIYGYGIPNFCVAHTILNNLLGVNEVGSNIEELTISPNPFNSDFLVSYYSEIKQNIIIQISDIEGREIEKFTRTLNANVNNTFQVSENNLSPGVYIARITTNEKIFYKKIVKQ